MQTLTYKLAKCLEPFLPSLLSEPLTKKQIAHLFLDNGSDNSDGQNGSKHFANLYVRVCKSQIFVNFATEIIEQDSSNFMGSLDIGLLLTKILFEESIDICANELFKNNSTVHGLKKVNSKIFYLSQQKSRIL